MFEQNYIQFSLDNHVFSIKVFPPKGKIDTPSMEAEKSAFYFYKKKYKSKRLILCMSGGLDSEIMAEAFLRANVPFSASIWKYKNNLNNYDIKHALMFCEKNKIDYEIEECDLELFYENKLHFYYGIKYLCNSPQIVVHLYFLEKLLKKPNIAVFLPWQPPEFFYCQNKKKFTLKIIFFRYLAYYRFFQLNKMNGSAYFIMCRTSLLHSFLKLPITRSIMNQDINFSYYSPYKIKTIMYQQGGFLSKPRKGKFTGFDKMKTVLQTKYGMDYNKAFRYPLMKIIPDPEQQLYISSDWAK